MKDMPKYEGDTRLHESEMKTNLYKAGGKDIRGGTIFVGSMIDCACVPYEAFVAAMDHCKNYPDNIYLLQSKMPGVFLKYRDLLPEKRIVGTTIETTESVVKFSKAPAPCHRMMVMADIDFAPKLVSIEPAFWFHVDTMLDWMDMIQPDIISIGGRTGGGNIDAVDASSSLIENLVHGLMDSQARIILKKNLTSRLEVQLFEELSLNIIYHNEDIKQMAFGGR